MSRPRWKGTDSWEVWRDVKRPGLRQAGEAKMKSGPSSVQWITVMSAELRYSRPTIVDAKYTGRDACGDMPRNGRRVSGNCRCTLSSIRSLLHKPTMTKFVLVEIDVFSATHAKPS
jgi:hypothetical protein